MFDPIAFAHRKMEPIGAWFIETGFERLALGSAYALGFAVLLTTVAVFADLIFGWGMFGDSGPSCNPYDGCPDPP